MQVVEAAAELGTHGTQRLHGYRAHDPMRWLSREVLGGARSEAAIRAFLQSLQREGEPDTTPLEVRAGPGASAQETEDATAAVPSGSEE